MAGMQRFVTYIYAYESGEKTKNTGYAKIEARGSNGRMEVHLSVGGAASGEAAVSFLYIEEGVLKAVSLGSMRLENGRGMGQFMFCTETLPDTSRSFEDMAGIEIVDINGKKYMSFWKDVEWKPALPKEERRRELNDETGKEERRHEKKAATTEEELRRVPEGEPQASREKVSDMTAADEKNAHKKEIEEAEQESLHTMEIPMRNVFPTYTMEEIWRNFEKARTCVQINDDVCAIQIELNDLRELPKRYWYLGNNSFLLHGFFNYHHLLLGKLPNGRWFLGIPGVYERQERVMASVFGFPGFVHVAEPAPPGEVLLPQVSPREKQRGVWYHILEE